MKNTIEQKVSHKTSKNTPKVMDVVPNQPQNTLKHARKTRTFLKIASSAPRANSNAQGCQNAPKIESKWSPKRSKKAVKDKFKKSNVERVSKHYAKWLPKWIQHGPKMAPKVV